MCAGAGFKPTELTVMQSHTPHPHDPYNTTKKTSVVFASGNIISMSYNTFINTAQVIFNKIQINKTCNECEEILMKHLNRSVSTLVHAEKFTFGN